jgi:hypothetical protein
MSESTRKGGNTELPLPLPGTVLFRSCVAGLTAGAVIGFVFGCLASLALADRVFFGLVGAGFGASFGIPVGATLGLVMASWFRISQPKRQTVRIAVTLLSVLVAAFVMWLLGPTDVANLYFIPLVAPSAGLLTWFGLSPVLRPTRSEGRDSA